MPLKLGFPAQDWFNSFSPFCARSQGCRVTFALLSRVSYMFVKTFHSIFFLCIFGNTVFDNSVNTQRNTRQPADAHFRALFTPRSLQKVMVLLEVCTFLYFMSALRARALSIMLRLSLTAREIPIPVLRTGARIQKLGRIRCFGCLGANAFERNPRSESTV